MDDNKMERNRPGGTFVMISRASRIAVPNKATTNNGLNIMASMKSGILATHDECQSFYHLTAGE